MFSLMLSEIRAAWGSWGGTWNGGRACGVCRCRCECVSGERLRPAYTKRACARRLYIFGETLMLRKERNAVPDLGAEVGRSDGLSGLEKWRRASRGGSVGRECPVPPLYFRCATLGESAGRGGSTLIFLLPRVGRSGGVSSINAQGVISSIRFGYGRIY